MDEVYLGIDVGSVTTKFVAIDDDENLIASLYNRTAGNPIDAIRTGLQEIQGLIPGRTRVTGVGTTGSGRQLAGVVVGADLVKNEITTHAVAALHFVPGVQTVIDIGGQDSKLILLDDGIVVDFAMNSVCAAGTGSFLEQQANRLGISINELGQRATYSKSPVRIAGRCTVFAESDITNLALGKTPLPPIVFQGGVAANAGVVRAFEEVLETAITVLPQHEVMGAMGAALLTREQFNSQPTNFKGFNAIMVDYKTTSFECKACPNLCEIAQIRAEERIIARWGGRCERWEIS
jgi:predicted CoA-substrate-specific enzyme activase